MKNLTKLIILSIFTFIISCSYNNYNAIINVKIQNKESLIGDGVGVKVTVNDSRYDRNVLGYKAISEEKTIKIGIDNDIENEIHSEIIGNLKKRGFAKGEDKIVGIHITKLDYKVTKQGFLISDSHIKAEIEVAIKDSKSNKITIKKYGMNSIESHFILPSKQDDQEIISEALSEIIQDMLSDEYFIQNLIS